MKKSNKKITIEDIEKDIDTLLKLANNLNNIDVDTDPTSINPNIDKVEKKVNSFGKIVDKKYQNFKKEDLDTSDIENINLEEEDLDI